MTCPSHLQEKASSHKKARATTSRNRKRRTPSAAFSTSSPRRRTPRPLVSPLASSISHRRPGQTDCPQTTSLFRLESVSKRARWRAFWTMPSLLQRSKPESLLPRIWSQPMMCLPSPMRVKLLPLKSTHRMLIANKQLHRSYNNSNSRLQLRSRRPLRRSHSLNQLLLK